jgi:hypothetical protein
LGITIDDVLRSVIALNWGAAGLISVALFWSLLPLAARMNKHREA